MRNFHPDYALEIFDLADPQQAAAPGLAKGIARHRLL